MTTFREFLVDLIREYFAIPRTSHATQEAAAAWQPQLPRNLADLPGYQPGQYARHYHNSLEQAIADATTPNLSRRPILKSLTNNPITPIPDAITPERESTPSPVDNSLILWTSPEDEDATEMRPAIRLPRMPRTASRTTGDLRVEVLLDVLAQPTHEQSTGENERINEDAFLR